MADTQQTPSYLLQEVKLYNNNAEREKLDSLGTLFSIYQMVEHLEKAYIKDAVDSKTYEVACSNLIRQYKLALGVVRSEIHDNTDKFLADYRLSCPAAKRRLQIGVPATVELGNKGSSSQANKQRDVAAVVSSFFTISDSLEMNMLAIDQIHPNLTELMNNLNKCTIKSEEEHTVRGKIREWLVTTNGMKATDELSEDQKRQLLLDLESAHTAFVHSLE